MGTSINLGIALFRINKGPVMARRDATPDLKLWGSALKVLIQHMGDGYLYQCSFFRSWKCLQSSAHMVSTRCQKTSIVSTRRLPTGLQSVLLEPFLGVLLFSGCGSINVPLTYS